jgi:hypothetical protein
VVASILMEGLQPSPLAVEAKSNEDHVGVTEAAAI